MATNHPLEPRVNAFILFSMLTDSTQDSHPYKSTVTWVVWSSLILVAREIEKLLQIFSNFKKAAHARAFHLVRSLIIEPSWIQNI